MINVSKIGCTLLILFFIISLGSLSYAQEQDIEEQINIRMNELDKALNLNDKQEKQIRNIYTEFMERMAEFRGNRPAPGGERGGMRMGMGMMGGGFGPFGRINSDIEEVLTPEQVTKFRAFNLNQQIESRMTSLDEMLNLNNDQETKIRKIVEQDIQETNKMFEEMRDSGGDPRDTFEQMRDRREEINKKIEAVLTSEQVKKYRESMSMMMGPGGPR
jgi:hypothetical protein